MPLHTPPNIPIHLPLQGGAVQAGYPRQPKLAPHPRQGDATTPGLAGVCVVSFGTSGNLTPVERKACRSAGCLSTC